MSKIILEDVCDNLFNPDPYYRQGGDMVRVGPMQYAIDPTQKIGSRIGKMTLRRTKSMTTKFIPILAVATLVACCANAQPKMELKDLKQKASYSIGADIASNMKKQEIDIDVKSLTAGFSDAFAGGKMLLPKQR